MKLMPSCLALFFAGLCVNAFADYPTNSVFHLRKNTNRNQVHYEVRVDEACRPLKRKPIHVYWREYEKGPDVTSKLRFWEIPGYGVRQPKSVNWSDNGGSFEFSIRGVPKRVIRLESYITDQGCRARAYIDINAEQVLFERIEIEVSGWANIHKVEIFGHSLSSDESVREITLEK